MLELNHDLELRFWIFSHPQFEALGGLEDIAETTDDIDKAKQFVFEHDSILDNIYIFDSIEKVIVWNG